MARAKKAELPAWEWHPAGYFERGGQRILSLPNFRATCTHTPHAGDRCGWCGAPLPKDTT